MIKRILTTALLGAAFTAALLIAGCDMAKDTADTTVKGGAGAGSVANKMKGGTVGDTDMDSGESASDSEAAGDDGAEAAAGGQ